MANDGLQKIGVDIVAEGLSSYQKNMSDYIKKTQDATKATTEFQDKSGKAPAKSGGILGFIKNLVSGFKDVATKATASIPGFEAVSAAIGGLSTGALVAAGSIAILSIGISALGQRGAEFIGIQRAFNNTLVQFQGNLGTSAEFLRDLRTAAGDTISELELMRITNIALAGATGEAGAAFGEALPKLLEIARVQAAATGQSVDHLFQSLVTGIKRSSPLLIDNTGLVLDITAANEAYAASIGKTVAQLTEEEKQIALIQATIAAGNQAIEAAGGVQETAADKMARANALIQNSLNNLSVAVEPILGGILDVFNLFMSGVERATAIIGPILRDVVLQAGKVIQFVAETLSPVFNFIMNQLKMFGGFLVEGIQFFLEGAARISGAIANGLLAGANTFIFPAVISIAQFIADFLSGFSPPKMGPLSTIDTGAANVMLAWTEGFVGAFKPQSIIDVASQVDAELGKIGSLGIGAVEKRIRQLDRALRPFQEQLKIVKDQFDNLKTAADAGLSAIDRQLERLQPALLAGDKQAEEMTRQLNVQRLAIQQNLDAQAEQVDLATLQLAYAQSQQQRERTLLEIQKARLGVQNKQAAAVKKTVAASGAKAPGSVPKVGTGGAGGSALPVVEPVLGAENTKEDKGAGAFGFFDQLNFDFMSQIDPANMALFNANRGAFDKQMGLIGKSDFGANLIGAFSGFGDSLQTSLVDPVIEKVTEAVGWFTDPEVEGGLANFFTRIREEGVIAVLGDLAPSFTEFLRTAIITPITALPVLQTIKDLFLPVNDWIMGASEDGGLPAMINQVGTAFEMIPDLIWSALQSIGLLLWNTLAVPFIVAINTIIQKINEFFGVINNSELVNFARTQLGIEIPEVSFDEISTAPPASLVTPPPPPARVGGLFSGGAVRTHREEVMMSSEPFAVFSQQFVKAMDVLSNAILSNSMFNSSVPVMASANSGNISNTRNININANMGNHVSPIAIANQIAISEALA